MRFGTHWPFFRLAGHNFNPSHFLKNVHFTPPKFLEFFQIYPSLNFHTSEPMLVGVLPLHLSTFDDEFACYSPFVFVAYRSVLNQSIDWNDCKWLWCSCKSTLIRILDPIGLLFSTFVHYRKGLVFQSDSKFWWISICKQWTRYDKRQRNE